VEEKADLGYSLFMNKARRVALNKRRIKAKKQKEKDKLEAAKK